MVAFQVPITFDFKGVMLEITTAANVARAHREGYAWHTWFSNEDRDAPASWRTLAERCVDGIMTARPRALHRVLARTERPAGC